MGAVSENITQQQNQATIDNVCSSRLTVNSGAGQEKGDAGGERAHRGDAAPGAWGQRGQGRHARRLGFREPVHRG